MRSIVKRLRHAISGLCGIILALHFCGTALAQSSAEDVSGQVTYLIELIRTSPCTFIRNGSDYDGAAAAGHIKQKYNYYKSDIHNAEDFISLAASKSYLSGRPYQVHCPGEQTVFAADWLRNKLQTYRSRSETTGSAN